MSRRLVLSAVLAGGLVVQSAAEPGQAPRACPAAPDDMVWVPEGETRIGADGSYPEEGPAYTVRVPGFWIDRHEVTNAQFGRFVAATGHVTEAERRGASIVFVPPRPDTLPTRPADWWRLVDGADWRHPAGPGSNLVGRGRLPVVHVAYADARAYAAWAGRSLPNEEQFERAARAGGAGSARPTPEAANSWQGHFPTRNTAEDGFAALAPAGCFQRDRIGANDLIGNAWEWTRSWYLPGHGPIVANGGAPAGPSFDPAQPGAETRVIKGGSFLCAPNYCARYRPEARHGQDETSGASHLGFRTVATEEDAGRATRPT